MYSGVVSQRYPTTNMNQFGCTALPQKKWDQWSVKNIQKRGHWSLPFALQYSMSLYKPDEHTYRSATDRSF